MSLCDDDLRHVVFRSEDPDTLESAMNLASRFSKPRTGDYVIDSMDSTWLQVTSFDVWLTGHELHRFLTALTEAGYSGWDFEVNGGKKSWECMRPPLSLVDGHEKEMLKKEIEHVAEMSRRLEREGR